MVWIVLVVTAVVVFWLARRPNDLRPDNRSDEVPERLEFFSFTDPPS